jgi:serine O-acetyltransferase
MQTSLQRTYLADYVSAQMRTFFPDRELGPEEIRSASDLALDRLAYCFDRLKNKYVNASGQASFDHLNTDQYAMFLYLLSNTLYRERKDCTLAAKAYALNKALHAIDVFYEVELPRVFLFQHPVGTVIGRAKFADYFMIYQRCSIGSSLEGEYPVFHEGVVMFGGSGVIGDCEIGPNSWLSAGTLLMNRHSPGDCSVFGQSPNNTVKPAKRQVKNTFFREKVEACSRFA